MPPKAPQLESPLSHLALAADSIAAIAAAPLDAELTPTSSDPLPLAEPSQAATAAPPDSAEVDR